MIPEQAISGYNTAQQLYSQNNFSGAATICLDLLRCNKESEELHYFMSVIARQKGNFDIAFQSAFKAHLLNKDNPKNLIALSEISYDLGDYERSLDFIISAGKLDNAHVRVLAQFTRNYLRLGILEQAKIYLSKYEQSDAENYDKSYLRQSLELQSIWMKSKGSHKKICNIGINGTYGLIRKCMESAEIEYLLNMAKSTNLSKGTVIGGDNGAFVKTQTRRANVLSLDVVCQHSRNIYEHVYAATHTASLALGINLCGPAGPLQLTEYLSSERGFYDWHVDTGLGAYKKRAISFSLLVSDRLDFCGGELLLSVDGKELSVPLATGDAVAFKSSTYHRVNEVHAGVRYSLVGWFDIG